MYSYAKTISNELSEELYAISFGEVDRLELEKLSTYGVTKVYSFTKIKGEVKRIHYRNEFAIQNYLYFQILIHQKWLPHVFQLDWKHELLMPGAMNI